MRQILTALVLAAGLQAQGADSEAMRLLRPDAGMMAGVQWRRLVQSPMGQFFQEEIRKSDMKDVPGAEQLKRLLMENVDSLVMAGPSSLMEARATPAKGQPPVLVVLRGRFNPEEIQGFFRTQRSSVEKYHGLELMSPPQTKGQTPMHAAVIDSGTLLLGDRQEVLAAIDRHQGRMPGSALSGVAARAAGLAARSDVWMTMEMPANAFQQLKSQAPEAQSTPMVKMITDLNGFEIGLNIASGLGIEMQLRTRTAEVAKNLADMVRGFIAMAQLNQDPKQAEATKWLSRVQITPESRAVRLALAMTQPEFNELVQQMRRSSESTASAGRPVRRQPSISDGPPTPPRPERNTIRIEGLDGGPVEIPRAK